LVTIAPPSDPVELAAGRAPRHRVVATAEPGAMPVSLPVPSAFTAEPTPPAVEVEPDPAEPEPTGATGHAPRSPSGTHQDESASADHGRHGDGEPTDDDPDRSGPDDPETSGQHHSDPSGQDHADPSGDDEADQDQTQVADHDEPDEADHHDTTDHQDAHHQDDPEPDV
jgi:hypothetical protein